MTFPVEGLVTAPRRELCAAVRAPPIQNGTSAPIRADVSARMALVGTMENPQKEIFLHSRPSFTGIPLDAARYNHENVPIIFLAPTAEHLSRGRDPVHHRRASRCAELRRPR